jgi:hypothetical protein
MMARVPVEEEESRPRKKRKNRPPSTSPVKRVFGGLFFLFGLCLACWIVYLLLFEKQPEGQTMSMLPAVFFSAGLLSVGGTWMFGDLLK